MIFLFKMESLLQKQHDILSWLIHKLRERTGLKTEKKSTTSRYLIYSIAYYPLDAL